MTVRQMADRLGLAVWVDEDLDRQVEGAYVADLLSDVIAHAPAGAVWVTLQTHANVAAVAALKELSAVVIVNGRRPEAEMLQRAREHKLNILGASEPAFEVAAKLYLAGLRQGK